MFYKTFIDAIRRSNKEICHITGAKEFNYVNADIMFKGSKVQQWLGNTYKLVKQTTGLRLQGGVSSYNTSDFEYTGTLTYLDKIDFVTADKVMLNNGTHLLSKVDLQVLESADKSAGFPQSYSFNPTIAGRQFEIDAIPNKSYADDNNYRLSINYSLRMDLFPEGSFSDYAEDVANFGGSFQLPKEWDMAIIEGVLADIFPERIPIYQGMVNDLIKSIPHYTDYKVPYFFGFK